MQYCPSCWIVWALQSTTENRYLTPVLSIPPWAIEVLGYPDPTSWLQSQSMLCVTSFFGGVVPKLGTVKTRACSVLEYRELSSPR
mmetsp:Transcript_2823/g.4277  ORF Transcript_2823/g.4277 Transcript_2823/m.4277 type:complete len:85 (+) Transcript_2823:1130-1384(+)